jgi:hypothetical protein
MKTAMKERHTEWKVVPVHNTMILLFSDFFIGLVIGLRLAILT